MIEVFENRFSIGYLQLLSRQLEISHLKKTAIELKRPEQLKELKTAGRKKSIPLNRAIKIDFCGFAASTLLGTNIEKIWDEAENMYGKDASRIMKLRRDIKKKFERLFDEEVLNDLNSNGIYLQVRFCFPYLYADFPISLMRAEDSNIWQAKLDHEISFSGNAPIAPSEWDRSDIYTSQIASLEALAGICKEHPSFAKTEEYDTAINTCETRFAVIPIPSCVLVINETAISDCYIYAKLTGDDDRLAFSTPVNVLRKFKDARARKGDKITPGYDMLRQNFLYIWRHDLTLYADMATDFKEKDPEGLTRIRPPWVKKGKKEEVNINWKKKIDRIIKKKKAINPGYDPNAPEEKRNIEIWTANVNTKFGLCTRKILHKSVRMDRSRLTVHISKKALVYRVSIRHEDEEIFVFAKPGDRSILFSAFAHFAYAKKIKCSKPSMPEYYNAPTSLKTMIIRQLAVKKRIKKEGLDAESLFGILFKDSSLSGWEFLVDGKNIFMEDTEMHLREINKAYYNKGADKKYCLDGLYKPGDSPIHQGRIHPS
jgi:hypothetical protein